MKHPVVLAIDVDSLIELDVLAKRERCGREELMEASGGWVSLIASGIR